MKILICIPILLCTLFTSAQNKVYPYFNGHLWGLSNEHCEVVAIPEFDENFRFTKEGLAIVRKDGKAGTLCIDGKMIIPCIYNWIKVVKGEVGTAKRSDGYIILINLLTGKQISPIQFTDIGEYCDCKQQLIIGSVGIGKISSNMFINTVTGEWLGEKGYAEARFLSNLDARAVVKTGGKYGMINTETGNWVLPAIYDRLIPSYYMGKSIIETTLNGEEMMRDANGKEIKQQKTHDTDTEDVVATTALGRNDQEYHQTCNKEVYISNMDNGRWKVTIECRNTSNNKVYETFELQGFTAVSKLFYSNEQSVSIKLLAVKDGRAGIIDVRGKVLAPFQYDTIVSDGSYSYVLTKLDGKTGILLKDMTEVSKPVFKKLISSDVPTDLWFIEMPDKQKGYMNGKTGKIYIPGVTD